MAEQADNLILELLRAIRSEQAEMNLKVGTLAQSMVSMRKDIDSLDTSVQGMRGDLRMIAIAIDEHTNRLDRIESHYNPPQTLA